MRPKNRLLRTIKKRGGPWIIWVLGILFLLMGGVLLWASTLQIPDLSSLENRVVEQSVNIYDRTGTILLYNLNNNAQRIVVPLSAISPNIQEATIAMEDPTFYQNIGIQPSAIARAALADLFHLAPVQGGSTITQQVVKETLLTNNKSITRKLKELVLALKLTRTLPKDKILEIYLNQTPYGGNIYGVEQASETFFNEHASDVDLAQAAYLEAVLAAPTYYSPYGNHKADLDARKNIVLQKMFEHGYITQAQLAQAQQEVVTFQPQHETGITAPHFVFYVEQYLESKYGAAALQQGGWKVITTLDADLQTQAEATVKKWALSNAQTYNASNAGLIAIDPNTGQILAMVGSRDYFDTSVDGNYNVTLALRQPGSTFKPFVYAEAFMKGYTPDTVLFDVPTQFSTTCAANNFSNDNGCYAPVNYDGQFDGPMTLRDALAQSRNVPSVKLFYLAGLNDSLELAKSMGISTLGDPSQYGLTLVLGGGDVTLLDMTSAYGTFATNGTHYEPVSVLKIEDQNGNVIEDNTQPVGTKVLPNSAAEEINSILSDYNARAPLGENDFLSFPGHDVAVKTGTTNDFRDAWTIGYTPNVVIGVWAGNNNNAPMSKKVSGFIVGPMWHEIMNYEINRVPNIPFTNSDIPPDPQKPILQGNWQIPGNDGNIHNILYWVDRNNPTGPPPSNPYNDPEFQLWDPPVVQWAQQHGFMPGFQQNSATTSPLP